MFFSGSVNMKIKMKIVFINIDWNNITTTHRKYYESYLNVYFLNFPVGQLKNFEKLKKKFAKKSVFPFKSGFRF